MQREVPGTLVPTDYSRLLTTTALTRRSGSEQSIRDAASQKPSCRAYPINKLQKVSSSMLRFKSLDAPLKVADIGAHFVERRFHVSQFAGTVRPVAQIVF